MPALQLRSARDRGFLDAMVDKVNVEERAARFTKRSIKAAAKVQGLLMAVSMCDLTTLEGKDTPGKVRQMCRKAVRPDDASDVHCGAVCVYPNLVPVAVQAVKGSGVKVAAVATGFPSGQYPLDIRLQDVRETVDMGADEIDMVINRRAFLEGEYDVVFDEIAAVKQACGNAHLKVILETGEIGTYDSVRRASRLAMEAGADFIKTSTGKVQPAATMPVTLVMLEAIRDFYFETGLRIGMKPAGGIRSAKEALHYLVMLSETLGDDWLTPDLFRFGASALLNDLLMQLEKERSGRYQGPDYFSLD
ncbi:MAG: deoxyribose-phosphate aldolase [Armatimonadetes bacterium]|nr:deoxyribose-phosphate aldolase [Armatimonadota bacterium]